MSSRKLLRFCVTFLMTLSVGFLTRPAEGQTTWHVDDDDCPHPGEGTTKNPFCTIQDGVDASSDGDTVLVGPGTYTGDGNRDISLFGKLITLKSADGADATTIDIEGGPDSIHRGFFLNHGETHETLIEGFTIKNGYLIGDTGGTGPGGGGGGGGFYIRSSSPTIRNCIVRDHVSAALSPPFPVDGRGGGIYIDGNSRAVIENCVIAGNFADRRGGGMYIGYGVSRVELRNCLVVGNTGGGGGGIYNTFARTTIVNTTIAKNVSGGGGGVVSENSEAVLSNCTLWGNQAPSGPQLKVSCPRVPTVESSDIQGGPEAVEGQCGSQVNWGDGNIDADPLFADAENGDYHLLPGSPCIDAGDNTAVPPDLLTNLDGFARFADDLATEDTGNGWPEGLGVVDMGPYEFGGDDCNNNGIPDVQDVADETSADCDDNDIPDECEPDCNANGQADVCDLAEEGAEDCDGNGILDECQTDCNANDRPDVCDLAEGTSDDCNFNDVPDECEVPLPFIEHPQDQQVQPGEMAIFSVEVDIILPAYQWRKDGVDLEDTDRIIGTNSQTLFVIDIIPEDAGQYDCVVAELGNECIATSDPATLTVHGPCPADFDDDGAVRPFDLAILLGNWGPNPGHPADLDADGTVGPPDLALLLGQWGPCE